MYLEGKFLDALLCFALGTTFASLSLLWMRRLKKVVPIPTPKPYKVISVTECEKCGLKSLREFREHDYVLKKAEKCPKCKRSMFISSIYLELPKK